MIYLRYILIGKLRHLTNYVRFDRKVPSPRRTSRLLIFRYEVYAGRISNPQRAVGVRHAAGPPFESDVGVVYRAVPDVTDEFSAQS